ncbi:MAG TPA: hypothetical protein VF487_13200 [Chitinophagaceae bacterium]
MQKQINAASFDNYDPDNFGDVQSDLYDPDYATGEGVTNPAATKVTNARPGRKLQINLAITNATASVISAELFSAFDSWTTRLKAELVVGAYAMKPALSLEGLAALIAAPTGGGVVGFNQAGNLEVRGGVGDPKLTIACGEYPYISLFESTKNLPFFVSYVRYTVSTDNQIDNNITHFTRTFGGGVKENVISPRAYFKPNQFQNKTIDILAPFSVDGECGLSIPVLAGEAIRMAFFIQRWAKNTL